MAWQSLSLSSVLGGPAAAANTAVSDATDQLNRLNALKAGLQAKLSDAQSAVDNLEALAADLEVSGIAMIKLSPETGAWDTRIASAANAPSTDPGLYTAAWANIIIDADITAARSALDSFASSLQAAVAKPQKPAPSFPTPPPAPPPTPEPPAEGGWESVSLGNAFPGQFETINAKIEEAKKALGKIQNEYDQLLAKISGVESSISENQATLSTMGATGVYNVFLTPAIGSWLNRLQSETGAPATPAGYATAGIVIVVTAADLVTATAAYDKLLNIVNTGV